MKKLLLIIPVLLAGMFGCKKDDGPDVDPRIEKAIELAQRREQFHGKYKLISSTSNIPVDVNLDGDASTDLLTEIEIFGFENHMNIVEVRVNERMYPHYGISQMWPEQYIWQGSEKWDGGSSIAYDPNLSVSYADQGAFRYIRFSEDLKEIFVEPNENENPYRWVRPESVNVDAIGRLHFVNRRHLYTRDGVKEVVIKSVYKRFTKDT